MAVRFVLGRAGTGKTQYCLDAISRALARDVDDRLFFLVPEQAAFQMERALADSTPAKGFWRAEVMGFSRLARRLIGEAGLGVRTLRPWARSMALRLICRRLKSRVDACYGRAGRTAGFLAALDRAIGEFLSEGIAPEALRAAAARVSPASTERVSLLAEIYGAYLDWLGDEHLDANAHLTLLNERIVGLTWITKASVWVDGFAGFTGQEIATLTALARHAHEVTITMLLDPTSPVIRNAAAPIDELGLFARTEETYARLRRALADAGAVVDSPVLLASATNTGRYAAAPGLARLERGFVEGAPPASSTDPPNSEVRVLRCSSHREEARQAARFIRRRIIESNGALRFRDFALIVRDLAPHAEMIADVFDEYEIPYFIDRRRSMRAHPLCRLVAALLAAARDDCPIDAMLRLLQTGLVSRSRSAAEQIEGLIRRRGIRGLAAWRMPRWEFTALPGGSHRLAARALNPKWEVVRRRIAAGVGRLCEAVRSTAPMTGSHWAKSILASLSELEVREILSHWIARRARAGDWEGVETHRLAWTTLCDVLEDLHELLGDLLIDVGEAQDAVLGALAERTLGLAPPTLDQVLVSSIERSRHPDVSFAWLMAFNEGEFPALHEDDPLLPTAARLELTRQAGVPLRVERNEALGERLLAYIASTRPSRGLTISYATTDLEGEALEPSPLLTDVRIAAPDVRVEAPAEYDVPVCVAELARRHVEWRRASAERGGVSESAVAARRSARLCERMGWRASEEPSLSTGKPLNECVGARLAWHLRGLTYTNEPAPVPIPIESSRNVNAQEPVWVGSPTEVETFLNCPFKHFAKHRLRLDDRTGQEPMVRLLGTVAHEALAEIFRRAVDFRGGLRALDVAAWKKLVNGGLERFADLARQLERTEPATAYMLGRLGTFVTEAVGVHAERIRKGQLTPVGFELAFGARPGGLSAAPLPGLRLNLKSGLRVELTGKIDRVDEAVIGSEAYLVVYDYKTQATFRKKPTVLHGPALQILVYALAAERGWKRPARVVGALIAPLRPNPKVLETKAVRECAEDVQRMHAYKPRGVFADEAAELLDTSARANGGPSPVVQLRYTKDGGVNRTQSDATGSEHLRALMDGAERTVAAGADGIVKGNAAVSPLLDISRRIACDQCGFRAICRYDRWYNRPRAIERTLPRVEFAEEHGTRAES